MSKDKKNNNPVVLVENKTTRTHDQKNRKTMKKATGTVKKEPESETVSITKDGKNNAEESSKRKLFVIDTNVPAHDYQSVYKFEENDICIPITVVQELDNLKTKGGSVSYNSRQALKFLDKYDGNISNKNKIRKDLGNVFILNITDNKFIKNYKKKNRITNMDDEIIMHAKYLQKINTETNEYEKIVLVSKDAGMRVKASAMGIKSEDYSFDSVLIENLYKGSFEVDTSSAIINELHNKKVKLDLSKVDFLKNKEYNYNSCFILKSTDTENHTALACFQKDHEDKIMETELKVVDKPKKSTKIEITTINAGQTFAYHLVSNPTVKLITITGKAGTGKTLIPLFAAIEQVLIGTPRYKNIIAMRPLVSLSNKDIGYLPGDEKQKISPFMRPIYDNLDFIKARSNAGIKTKIKQALEDGTINIEAMAHVRGRTYNDTLIIIDEAQNLTPMEAKTLITRMGKNSKIILAGDIQQIDAPYLNESSNGLSHVIDKFSKENTSLYAHINLEKGERSELATLGASIL